MDLVARTTDIVGGNGVAVMGMIPSMVAKLHLELCLALDVIGVLRRVVADHEEGRLGVIFLQYIEDTLAGIGVDGRAVIKGERDHRLVGIEGGIRLLIRRLGQRLDLFRRDGDRLLR